VLGLLDVFYPLKAGHRERIDLTMNRSHHSKRLMFAIALVFALPASLPAQVTVLMSGGFSAAYQELLPQFEKSTGITVSTIRGASQGDGPTTIGAQLRRGLPADVVIHPGKGSPSC
jgi:molybdate transport system substrate-binding protein